MLASLFSTVGFVTTIVVGNGTFSDAWIISFGDWK